MSQPRVTPTAAPGRVVRPLRDAVLAALAVSFVSGLGLAVTYYFSRQVQIESEQRALLQLARVAATTIDVAAYQTLDDPADDGGETYRRVLAPLVALQRAAPEVYYLYTLTPAANGRGFVHGVDTATVYRVPGDSSERLALLQPYTSPDDDLDRTLAARTPQVNSETWTEPGRRFLSAYAPFFDAEGRVAGIVEVDMWVQTLEAHLQGLRRIVEVSAAGLALLSLAVGAVVFRHRKTAEMHERRDIETARVLATARDAAEAASRQKSEFVATMSNELRTPLNAILGYSELIDEELVGLGDETTRHDVARIAAASRHLADIIGDILDYTKVEAGLLAMQPQPTDVAHLLGDLAELLRPGAVARGLDLVVDSTPDAVVVADPVRLRQVLLNLVGNAIKFTERGRITVRARLATRGERVAIVVHDTGVGIPREAHARLFEPFAQVARGAKAAAGTGLGLTISRRLVDAMGGELRFRSRSGVGSSFRLVLPRHHTLRRAA
ncbi:MAG: HAMP domain-containing sensor histidine kinase [Vicinamibacterales bacterium]